MLDKIFELTVAGLAKKQKSVTKLFPPFYQRVDKVKAKGGIRLKSMDSKTDTWTFAVHSGTIDEQPKSKSKKPKSGPVQQEWYTDIVKFKNIPELVTKYAKNKMLWNKAKTTIDYTKLAKQILKVVDIELFCNCPAAQFWGPNYQLTKRDAKYGEKELRPPKKRNPKQYGIICKHAHAVMLVGLPFYSSTFAKYLKDNYSDIANKAVEQSKKELNKFKSAAVDIKKDKEEMDKRFTKGSVVDKEEADKKETNERRLAEALTNGQEEYYDRFIQVEFELLTEYAKNLDNPNYRQQWQVLPFARVKKIWSDFVKFGFVRDESAIDDFSDIVIENIIKIEINNILTGHSSTSPIEYAESVLGDELPDDYFELIEHFFDDDNGNWRISDYSLEPLQKLAFMLLEAKTAEEKLVLIDRIFNIAHARSDLSSWFIEGGAISLSKLAGIDKLDEKKINKRYFFESIKDRLGKCYTLAGRYVVDSSNDNVILVHGTINGIRFTGKDFDNPHAWVEEGDEVFDLVWNKRFPKDVYYEITQAKVIKKYSKKEVHAMLANIGTWGPWEKKITNERISEMETEKAPAFKILAHDKTGYLAIISEDTKYHYAGSDSKIVYKLNWYAKKKMFGKGWQLLKTLRLLKKDEIK